MGVAMVANKKALYVRTVPQFEAHRSQYFAKFDCLVVLPISLDAHIFKKFQVIPV